MRFIHAWASDSKFISILKSANPPNCQFRDVKTRRKFYSFTRFNSWSSFLSSIVRSVSLNTFQSSGGWRCIGMRTNNTKIHFDFVEKLGETTKTRVETRLPWRATWRAFIFVRANSAFNRHNRGEYRFWTTSKCVFNVLFIRINTRSSLNHHCRDGMCTLVTRSACLKRFEERLGSNRALWFDANALGKRGKGIIEIWKICWT